MALNPNDTFLTAGGGPSSSLPPWALAMGATPEGLAAFRRRRLNLPGWSGADNPRMFPVLGSDGGGGASDLLAVGDEPPIFMGGPAGGGSEVGYPQRPPVPGTEPPRPGGGYSMEQWEALKAQIAGYPPEIQKQIYEGLSAIPGRGGQKYDYLQSQIARYGGGGPQQPPLGGGGPDGGPEPTPGAQGLSDAEMQKRLDSGAMSVTDAVSLIDARKKGQNWMPPNPRMPALGAGQKPMANTNLRPTLGSGGAAGGGGSVSLPQVTMPSREAMAGALAERSGPRMIRGGNQRPVLPDESRQMPPGRRPRGVPNPRPRRAY
jgi:hypothetical protein